MQNSLFNLLSTDVIEYCDCCGQIQAQFAVLNRESPHNFVCGECAVVVESGFWDEEYLEDICDVEHHSDYRLTKEERNK